MPTNEKILLSTPHMSGLEQKYIKEAFDLNWVAPAGNNLDQFENELAAYNQVSAAVALSSATAAIHLALRLLGIKQGDDVFCSTLTFVASANPILYLGARPVFIDSEPSTWNMSPQALERAFTAAVKSGKLPKAVILVHLYGQNAQIDEIMEICNAYGVPIIEDAAESLGSTYKGKKSGIFGKYGVYSFNGNKIITTSGGGALISNDIEAIERARFLSTQARDSALHYQHSEMGYNYRLSNVSAGIGRGQLEVLDERVAQRRAVFDRYYSAFKNIDGIDFQRELPESMSNRWLTAFTLDPGITDLSSIEVIKTLSENGIEARPAWKPMHLQPLFEDSPYYKHRKNISVSDRIFENGICMPSGSNMSVEQQNRVISIVTDLLKGSLHKDN